MSVRKADDMGVFAPAKQFDHFFDGRTLIDCIGHHLLLSACLHRAHFRDLAGCDQHAIVEHASRAGFRGSLKRGTTTELDSVT
jgi:hypothetical protein